MIDENEKGNEITYTYLNKCNDYSTLILINNSFIFKKLILSTLKIN